MARQIRSQELLRLQNTIAGPTEIPHRYIIVRDDGNEMKIISRRNELNELICFGNLYELRQGEHMLLVEIETLLVHWEKTGPLARPYASV